MKFIFFINENLIRFVKTIVVSIASPQSRDAKVARTLEEAVRTRVVY